MEPGDPGPLLLLLCLHSRVSPAEGPHGSPSRHLGLHSASSKWAADGLFCFWGQGLAASHITSAQSQPTCLSLVIWPSFWRCSLFRTVTSPAKIQKCHYWRRRRKSGGQTTVSDTLTFKNEDIYWGTLIISVTYMHGAPLCGLPRLWAGIQAHC